MGYFDKPKQGFDYLPWTDSETIFLWDCKFACCSSEEQKDAIRYPYAWVLVHSRIPNDIHRGMDMLRDSAKRTNINPKQKKKEMYLLAVGQFRCRGYSRSETLVDRCLEIKPKCWKSLFLEEVIAYRYKKETKQSTIFIDPPVTSVEFVTGLLQATPCTSLPTWGIEKVPSWMHTITFLKKESTQQTIINKGMLGSTKEGYDYLPWTDPETVLLWDCKFACCSSMEQKDVIRYPYAWVLVHSRQSHDVYRGMNMLKGSVESTSINPKQKKKEMYLLAVGIFRCRDYPRSEKFVDSCLEITPNCWKSLFLKELITYRYRKERKPSSIFIDSPVTSVEFVTSVLAAAPRASHPTWGIEKVPKWTHPITNKKAIQHALEEDLLYVCLVSVVAFGFGLAAVLFRSK